ncbi:MAG: winged helix-turn-helix domain-containing protein [Candidatus Sericytochromatia bacterium]|nr:winged helix-turn-helix domain-containing protein [Candidatus Tanganyikabacteria bacterium]
MSRPRLLELLPRAEAGGRVELVAGAGAGKTVLAVSWAAAQELPVVWVTLVARHADPHALASALCGAVRRVRPGLDAAAQELLARSGGGGVHGPEAMWTLAGDLQGDEPWAWVLDGIEVLEDARDAARILDELLRHLPETHLVVLAGRLAFTGAGWRKARLEGRMTHLDGTSLRFSSDDVRDLARLLDRPDDEAAVERALQRASGWPLGVSLVLRGDSDRMAPDLEGYLVDEVLAGLSSETAALLEILAPLTRIPPSLVLGLGARATASRMTELVRQGVLLPPAGDGGYVVPEALREVLLARLERRGARDAACQALIGMLLDTGLEEEAYRLACDRDDRVLALTLLGRLASGWLAEGLWHRTRCELAVWDRPGDEPSVTMCWLRGELARAEGRYPQALEALVEAAGCPDAGPPWPALLLVARAGVHLETVEPLLAQAALDEAQQRAGEGPLARSLGLARAENALNLGQPVAAAALLERLSGDDAEVRLVRARLALRTGRHAEAAILLPLGAGLSGRGGHRNPELLQALIASWDGRPDEAFDRAEAVAAAAERAASPVTRVVALTRAGHALAALRRPREARNRYTEALRLVTRLAVPRLGAEAELGLGLLEASSSGALERLERAALLGRETGDVWFEALAATALALAAPGAGRREHGLRLAEAVGDPWLAGLPEAGGAGWLRGRPAGEPAGAPGREAAPALLVRTLGGLAVFRDGMPIPPRAWTRDKARQLLAVLAAHPGEVLPKSRLIDMLWPELDPEQADGTFRVVLNALQRILEPDRSPKAEPRFVVREGPGYRLAGPPDVAIDLTALGRLLDQVRAMRDDDPALLPLLARLPAHAPGVFLPEMVLDDPWCDRLRDRVEAALNAAGLRWARLSWQAGALDLAAAAAEFLVGRDPSLEEAWRLWMAVQARVGERSAALRTWDRCVTALDRELDQAPSDATEAMATAIRGGRQLPDPWSA